LGPEAAVEDTASVPTRRRTPLFDLDGTLVDSDAALLAPFTALGVDPTSIPLGLPLGEACSIAGVDVDVYLARYDVDVVQPFPGVTEMLAELDRWAVCSNKARASGVAELARLGWTPTVALFSDDFGGLPKALAPVLDALGVRAAEAVFVGDTEHDRASAARAGVDFVLAGWNPRARAEPGDVVLHHPSEVLDLLA
jgi:phosphoglycolate phosphatase-like HAD superfamily hydrolase